MTTQCETCKHNEKRSCIYHGYPTTEIPNSCAYKLGTHAEEAMRNLNGTHIDVWTKKHDAEIAKKERERVLGIAINTIKELLDFPISSGLRMGLEEGLSVVEALRGDP
jgi:hypothetical protein